jgi:carbon storage regulator
MLILGRKVGETIRINENVKVTILHISPTQIKLGIEAPDDVRIFRSELLNNEQSDDKAEE